MAAPRDPERTRRRILIAAEREFAAKGLAGARVDAIAQRAGVNKRMLYHYFGNKEGLYRAVLLEELVVEGSPFQVARSVEADPEALLVTYNRTALHKLDVIRLLQWEALSTRGGAVAGEEERRRAYAGAVKQIEAMQDGGMLPAGLDPAQLLLTLIGLVCFPIAFPQWTRLITGRRPRDPEFQEQRVAFLRAVGRLLKTAAVSGRG
jgi:TetR/AcrR family transcriptional regulator